MELNSYIDIISLRLAILSNEVKLKSAVNLLDSNVLSEDVFKTILNTIYGWNLQNANMAEQNIKAIDLVDNTAKIFVQVSSDNSKAKVQSSLNKIELPKYSGYTFKFVCISKGVSNLKKSTFVVPDGISFNVDADSYDDKRLLRDVMAKDIDTIAKLASFLEKSIKLLKWKIIVSEYAVYSVLVDKIYKQYDKLGVNKSLAVLASLHDLYLNLSLKSSGDDLFDKLLEKVYEIVDGDGTCNESLTREELMMNIKIVLVDAFVKCKIFEKPE